MEKKKARAMGLAGEIRGVPRAPLRVAEARKLGFTRIVLPRVNADRLERDERAGVELVPIARLDDALEAALTIAAPSPPVRTSATATAR